MLKNYMLCLKYNTSEQKCQEKFSHALQYRFGKID